MKVSADSFFGKYGVLWAAALGLLIYLPSFQAPFQLDDYHRIAGNPLIKNPALLAELWKSEPARFLTNLTFALNYQINGLSVTGYHVFNLIVHILNAGLAALLALEILRILGKGREEARIHAALCALIFLCHPLQTQGVTYIIQRAVSLGTFFYLTAFLSYLKFRESRRHLFWFLSAALYIAALSCKENTVTLPFVLFIFELVLFRSGLKDTLRRLFPLLLLPALIPLYYRYHNEAFSAAISPHDYLATQLRVLSTYGRLLLIPWPQQLEYDYPVFRSFLNPQVAASAGFWLLLGYAAWLYRNKAPALLTGYLFFILTLAPDSSIAPLNDVIFEHRLYLPMFGFALAISSLSSAIRRRHLLRILLITWIAALAGLTWHRNSEWRDPVTLLENNLRHAPGNARLHLNLGHLEMTRHDYRKAEGYFLKALELKPDYARALNNLGVIYFESEKPQEALKAFRRAAELEPDLPHPVYMQGLIHLKNQSLEEAGNAFTRALKRDPEYVYAYAGLAQMLIGLNRPDAALETLQTGLALAPENGTLYFLSGEALSLAEKWQDAAGAYKNAARFGLPENVTGPRIAEIEKRLTERL